MDAFDAGALVAAAADQPLGRHVRALFEQRNGEGGNGNDDGRGGNGDGSNGDGVGDAGATVVGVGSVLLLAELARPLRECSDESILLLHGLLRRLDLRPVDDTTVGLATALATKYDLTAIAAVHLATAVVAGADRLVTTNLREYARSTAEVEIITPADLGRAERARRSHGTRMAPRFVASRR